MKTKFFFVIFQLSLIYSSAQDYISFPNANASWRYQMLEASFYYLPLDSHSYYAVPVSINRLYDYSMRGDTIIDSKSFKKIFILSNTIIKPSDKGYDTVLFSKVVYTYRGAIREEGKKIYFVDLYKYSEALLYNFDVKIGDIIKTLQTRNHIFYVESVDSVLVGNHYRKRFNYNGESKKSVIEGIGSTTELFEPFEQFYEWGYYFICFKQNNDLYVMNEEICNEKRSATTIRENATSKNSMTIFPNPFNSQTTIKYSNNNTQIRKIHVFDLAGKKIRSINEINESQYVFQKESLEAGIYFIEALTNDGRAYWDKMIIE